jgi:CheY-like chemotaxis protein
MGKTILLAEDSPDDELFFRRILNSVAVTNPIQVVRDGRQAIAYLNGEGIYADREKFPLPGALFLDLVMHPVNGFEVLEWLKTQPSLNEMLVVVLSNFSEGRMLRDAYAMGADSFLFKPFSKPDMENLLQHFPGHLISSRHQTGEPRSRLKK